MNLYDMMRAAGGGSGFEALASRYGLSESDVRKAAEALLPAFSLALRRLTADPAGLIELARRMMIPGHLQSYRAPGMAAGAAGEDSLAFLFGSPEAARAIAEQASAFAGIAAETMRTLMPPLASMLLGGLAGGGGQSNPFLAAMAKAFHAEPKRPAGKGPLDRYEEEEARREENATAAAAAAAAQAEMLKVGLAAFGAGAQAWAEALTGKSGGPKAGAAQDSLARSLETMLEPGLKVAEDYRRTLEAMLSSEGKGSERR